MMMGERKGVTVQYNIRQVGRLKLDRRKLPIKPARTIDQVHHNGRNGMFSQQDFELPANRRWKKIYHSSSNQPSPASTPAQPSSAQHQAPASNPPNIHPLHLGPFNFPLISQRGIERVSDDDRQAKAPDESNSVEEIGVAGTGVDPQVVESGSEEGCVEDCGCGEEGVAHYCRSSYINI